MALDRSRIIYMCLWCLLFTCIGAIITIQENEANGHQDKDKFFASVMQIAMEARIVADEQGTMLYVAPSAAEIAGYQQPELIGRNIEVLIPDGYVSEHRTAFNNAVHNSDETIAQVVCALKKKDGSNTNVEIRVRVLPTNHGKLVLVTLTPVELLQEI